MPSHRREELVDESGRVDEAHSTVRTAYAILLGFTVLVVWQQWNSADTTTQNEAADLGNIYWTANQFPEQQRNQIQDLARSYAQTVIDEEWPLMEQEQHSRHVDTILKELRDANDKFAPGTIAEQNMQSQELTRINALASERGQRLLASRTSLPSILRIVLIVGGVILAAFYYFTETKPLWVHTWAVLAATATIVLVLATVFVMAHPFSGPVRIQPDALEFQLQEMEGE